MKHKLNNQDFKVITMDELPFEDERMEAAESLLGHNRKRKNLPGERINAQKKSYKCYLYLICINTFFVFTGYSALAPNLTAIAKDFKFNDEERDRKLGRDLNTVYLLLSAPITFIITYAADKVNRKWLFAFNTILCNLSGILTGCARSYTELFMYRGISGCCVGAAMPILFSLLGDIYPPEKRSNASALASIVMGAGMLLGQVMSGVLGPSHGWRSPFLFFSIPGLLFSLVTLKMEPPPRGAQEGAVQESNADYNGSINMGALLEIFKIPTNVCLFLQGIPGSMPWGVIFVYLTDYLSQDAGLSVQQATVLVVVFGVGGSVGSVIGGMIGQKIYNRNKVYLPIFMGVMTILGTPSMLTLMYMKMSFKPLYILL